MIKAVLFDIDNTLTWTDEHYIISVFSNTLKELKENSWTHQELLNLWYTYKRNQMIKARNIDSDIFWKTFLKYDTKRINHTHFFKDSKIIKQLKKQGYKIALVTGASLDITDKVADKIGRQYLDEITVANDAKIFNQLNAKPSPDSINHCLSNLHIKNSNACYVGNGEEDILAAQNANVLDILIKRKTHPLEIKVKPTIEIDSLYELIKYI